MYLFQVFFLENKLKLCIHPYTSQWNKIYTEKSVFICGHLAVGTIIVKQVLDFLVLDSFYFQSQFILEKIL